MPYPSDLAKLLAAQFGKFVTLNRHQLAGQVANLDFWLSEVGHCLDVLDGYSHCFERLKTAQRRYVAEHHTREFDLRDPYDTGAPAAPPKRVPDSVLQEARRSLSDAAYGFLVRCFRDRMIDEATLRQGCDRLGFSIEPKDLQAPA
jgi:hypothetical protein